MSAHADVRVMQNGTFNPYKGMKICLCGLHHFFMEFIMKLNKKHKDSLFSTLFNNPDVLRELYSAIEGVTIPQDMPIDINTLTDVLIKDKINDVSFTIDNRLVILVEHQSTINENLPLRLLEYIGRVYEKIVNYKRRFQKKLEKIPKPEFIVLYNGNEMFPEHNAPMEYDEKMMVVKITVKEYEDLDLENKLYSIEAVNVDLRGSI